MKYHLTDAARADRTHCNIPKWGNLTYPIERFHGPKADIAPEKACGNCQTEIDRLKNAPAKPVLVMGNWAG